MTYSIQPTKTFFKHYRKLSAEERNQVDDKLRLLTKNPWHPSLRTKRIQGTDEFETSVNMDVRMAITFEGDRIIIALDVDHHDKLLDRRTRR